MTCRYLDTLSVEEKQLIVQKTEALAEKLGRWASKYSVIRSVRVPMVALSSALPYPIVTPPRPITDYLPLAQTTLWTFGVDDKTDEQQISFDWIRRQAEIWYAVATDGRGGASHNLAEDEFAQIILDARETLVEFPLFEPMLGEWVDSIRVVLEGIIREYQYALDYRTGGVQFLPSVEEYVQNGQYSIGVPFWAITFAIILGDPLGKECFGVTTEAVELSGAAIRLYNDLKSFEKEMREGTINSVLIMYHEIRDENPHASEAEALAEAKERILRMADDRAQRCYDLVARGVGSKQFMASVARTVAFHADFYRVYDYHITSLDDIRRMFM